MLTLLAAASFVLALIPAVVFRSNLRAYRVPTAPALPAGTPVPRVSVLVPARNEERSIERAVQAALASRGVELEVIVLDDDSEDATAACVARIAERDSRVRLLLAPPLPAGWCGKQHACAELARAAKHPLFAFLDADVRLEPDGLARMAAFLETARVDLASGIPRQETGSFSERLVIPLIHFVLLGFLSIHRMRRSLDPRYGAGCGQLFFVRRCAYLKAGGHAAIRASLHDGVALPRAFRAASLRTDLCDATELAVCRMYEGGRELWRGLAKNATEGLANPVVIAPATLMLFGGEVLPVLLLAVAPALSPRAFFLALCAAIAAFAPRLIAAQRFRQSWLGALLHPLGILVLLAIQWYALARSVFGRPAQWKGRSYPPADPWQRELSQATL
jgi:cellulose synthase/poly-beta-1,6-N-acetylglucosamine synthase-like glycosyltransferase